MTDAKPAGGSGSDAKPAGAQPAGQRWTESLVAGLLARNLFSGRSVLVVPNCGWIGHECDLLVVEPGLRIVEVEVKISRADLRADLAKDKWWRRRPWSRRHVDGDARTRREWPAKVWKHYYAFPESLWTDSLLAQIPETSGVILLVDPDAARTKPWLVVRRRAKPNREAAPIGAADCVDIARLASLRMWAALEKKPTT